MKPVDFLMGVTVAIAWGMGFTLAKAGAYPNNRRKT